MISEEPNPGSETLNGHDASSEEDKILQSIFSLRAEFDRIVSTTGPSKRSHCIRNEIDRLEEEYGQRKAQARERAARAAQAKG